MCPKCSGEGYSHGAGCPRATRYFKIKEIPPQWVGREGSERAAGYTWTRDPSWAHEYATKRQLRGAKCLIIPTNDVPPWEKP